MKWQTECFMCMVLIYMHWSVPYVKSIMATISLQGFYTHKTLIFIVPNQFHHPFFHDLFDQSKCHHQQHEKAINAIEETFGEEVLVAHHSHCHNMVMSAVAEYIIRRRQKLTITSNHLKLTPWCHWLWRNIIHSFVWKDIHHCMASCIIVVKNTLWWIILIKFHYISNTIWYNQLTK